MTREESQSAGRRRVPSTRTRLARRGRETVLSVVSVVRSRSHLTFDLASQSPSTGKFHRSSTSETPHRGGGHHVPSEGVWKCGARADAARASDDDDDDDDDAVAVGGFGGFGGAFAKGFGGVDMRCGVRARARCASACAARVGVVSSRRQASTDGDGTGRGDYSSVVRLHKVELKVSNTPPVMRCDRWFALAFAGVLSVFVSVSRSTVPFVSFDLAFTWTRRRCEGACSAARPSWTQNHPLICAPRALISGNCTSSFHPPSSSPPRCQTLRNNWGRRRR